jgi:hypothetical protein
MPHSDTASSDEPSNDGLDGPIKFVTASDGMIELIDTTNPQVSLLYTRDEIAAFLYGAKQGEFDHLLPPG